MRRRRRRRRKRRAISSFVKCPFGVAINGKSFFDSLKFSLSELFCRWDKGSTTSEGMDGGVFV